MSTLQADLQIDLQIALRDACNFREHNGDLQTFKRILYRIEHALLAWIGPEEDTCNSNEEDTSHSDFILQADTLSGFIKILTEVQLPTMYVKANVSIEVLFYRKVLCRICDAISKYARDSLDPIELDKVIDKVASLLLDEDVSPSIYQRELLYKLLHIITSTLISVDVSSKPPFVVMDGEHRSSPLRLTVEESIELTRILMQSSLRKIQEALTHSDKCVFDEDNDCVQLHVFLGFVFQHLLSFNLPFHDMIQLQYSAKDSAIQQYIDLVDSYLRETIEYTGNLNCHTSQIVLQRHSMSTVSQLQDVHQTISLVNACIRYTSLSLGMIETVHMDLRATSLSFDDMFATLWMSYGELVAYTCRCDILDDYKHICDSADDLLLRFYRFISDDSNGWSVSYRKSHERAFHGATITTLCRFLHLLDSRQTTDLELGHWLDLLLNHFRVTNITEPTVSTLSLTDILYFVMHYLVTYEGEFAPYLISTLTQSDSTNDSDTLTDRCHPESTRDDGPTTSPSHDRVDPFNPWHAVISKKLKDHILFMSHAKHDPPTTSTNSSSVSDLSFPNKRHKHLCDMESPLQKYIVQFDPVLS
jgi:hypothetical protein